MKLRLSQEEVIERLRALCARLGIPLEIVYKVYCQDEKVSETLMEKLLQLENMIVEELNVGDVDEIFEVFCTLQHIVETRRTQIEEERTIEKIRKITEQVFKVPVYVGGEARELNIVIKGRKVQIESDIEHVCKEPTDVIIGQTTIYLKCGDQWVSLVHGLKSEQVRHLNEVIKKVL